MKNEIALKKAIELAGSQQSLARMVGKNQGHVAAWLRRGYRVPPRLVLPLSRALGGQVTPFELRPDIFGNDLNEFLKIVNDNH